MHLELQFFSISSLLRVLMCISASARANFSATTTATPVAAVAVDAVSKDAAVAENWIPSDEFSNTSSINWFAGKRRDNVKETKTSSLARNFQGDEDDDADDDVTSIDRAFNNFVNYNSEFNERDEFKAIPFQVPELVPASNGNGNSNPNSNNALHFHSTIFQPHPQQQQQQQQQQQPQPQHLQSNVAKPYYPSGTASAAHTSPYSPNNGHAAAISISSVNPPHSQLPSSASYTSNAYHQPYQTPSQNLENFDYPAPAPAPAPYPYPNPNPYPSYSYGVPSQNAYPSRFTDNSTNNLELNTRHILFLQPGKCSNSIEVGRLRDLEIKATVKSGGTGAGTAADSQKAVCVLMLYSANENNKLAISMQSTLDSAFAELAAENWLETNVKVYSLQGGAILRTPTNANFGPGSPALILTKSSIVLLSIVSDRTLDFQIDISTYQSKNC